MMEPRGPCVNTRMGSLTKIYTSLPKIRTGSNEHNRWEYGTASSRNYGTTVNLRMEITYRYGKQPGEIQVAGCHGEFSGHSVR